MRNTTVSQPTETTVPSFKTGSNLPMKMLAIFLTDMAVHIYGIDCEPCTWGPNEQNQPVFRFVFEDTEENNVRFSKFLNDFESVPTTLPRGTNPDAKMIAFDTIGNAISYLEHFSSHKNWGLNQPLEEFVCGLLPDNELDNHFANINSPPDDSIMFLRRDVYGSFGECLPELKAAFMAARNCIPNVKFAYTLNEARRCLNAVEIKETGNKRYNTSDALWFH